MTETRKRKELSVFIRLSNLISMRKPGVMTISTLTECLRKMLVISVEGLIPPISRAAGAQPIMVSHPIWRIRPPRL